ncbi:MAG: GNAT family N-acetyltransferase [Gammaproteobacteria bacterium]
MIATSVPWRVKIEQCDAGDVDAIFALYEHAVRLQHEKGATPWPVFDRGLVTTEISEGRQWKIVVDGHPRCVWGVAYNDPLIWGERDADPAIYIHRIATDPAYRGRGFVKDIVEWSRRFAAARGRRYVRLDTVGNNTGLISHYTRCGFAFLGLTRLENTAGLPSHYHHATVSLFELDLGASRS